MKPKKTWTKARRRNGHPIPKLWIRESGTYYAQMAILDPTTGKNVTKKICLDTHDLKVAETKLAKLVTDRANGELKLRDDGPLLKDFLPHFLEIRKQERDDKTYRNEKSFLGQFEEFAEGKRLGEIKVRDIFDYRTEILESGIVNHTANLHVTAIRNLFKQAIIEELVDENPALKIPKLDHIPKPKRLLTDDEITLLAKTAKEVLPMAGQPVSDWILLMAFSGGRMNEVLSLQWGDIDFAGRKLNFRRETVKFKQKARSVDSPLSSHHFDTQLSELRQQRLGNDQVPSQPVGFFYQDDFHVTGFEGQKQLRQTRTIKQRSGDPFVSELVHNLHSVPTSVICHRFSLAREAVTVNLTFARNSEITEGFRFHGGACPSILTSRQARILKNKCFILGTL